MKRLLVIAMLALTPMTAHAEFYTGNEIYPGIQDWVDGDGVSAKHAFLTGYVLGVADTSMDVMWCPTYSVTVGQTTLIVHKWLQSHPESLHFTGDSLVVSALREAFPCKK